MYVYVTDGHTMRKSDIAKGLPTLTKPIPQQRRGIETGWGVKEPYKGEDYIARKAYGSHCKPLTLEIRRRLKGKKVWALTGQGWTDRIEEPGDKDPQYDLSKRSRMDWLECLDPSEDWLYEDGGRLVVGSGGDPVYVFV